MKKQITWNDLKIGNNIYVDFGDRLNKKTYNHKKGGIKIMKSTNIFIKVTGEDGIFFDLVRDFEVKEHIDTLVSGGYIAEMVTEVPPCIYRDFTCTNGIGSYTEKTWENGTDFYIK